MALQPGQLLPELSGGGGVAGYVAAPWARGFAATAAACAAGAPAAACLAPFAAATPLPLHTGVPPANYTHDFELWSLSPRYASGWAVVGELGKVVRVSPARFAYIQAGPEGLQFEVLGAEGEVVVVSVLAPPAAAAVAAAAEGPVAGSMLAVVLNMPSSGVLTVTCSGAGAAAACQTA